jgi:2-amino-4-hydroxy-6-hydroxymethyldihydropteridine diphosphokinase
MRAGIALGSNVGDRLGNLNAARGEILNLPGVRPPIFNSPIYETEPVDCEPGAASFLNAVIDLAYDGNPHDLFGRLREIEVALGRARDHQKNMSRPIDLDLLYCDDIVVSDDQLQLPHPRIADRRFVLQPLADIDPGRVLPGQKRTVRELLASAPQSATVVRSSLEWEVR